MSAGNVNKGRSLKIAVIGAGVRGTNLARKLSLSQYDASVVAVAEPEKTKREAFAAEFGLSASVLFKGWEELTENLSECDAVIIATLDNQHTGPALACLGRGWNILIEKPLADTLEDCRMIVSRQKEQGNVVAVCHTLRFMEGFRTVRQLLTEDHI
jgi:predicted dehydrogenase